MFGKDFWECFLASSHGLFAVICVPGNLYYSRKLDLSHIIKKLHFQAAKTESPFHILIIATTCCTLWSLHPHINESLLLISCRIAAEAAQQDSTEGRDEVKCTGIFVQTNEKSTSGKNMFMWPKRAINKILFSQFINKPQEVHDRLPQHLKHLILAQSTKTWDPFEILLSRW